MNDDAPTIDGNAIKIGSPVWIFDINHRVYRKGPDGRSLGGGPIWREHWVKYEVIGETSRSWIVGHDSYERCKVSKKGHSTDVCFSEMEIDRAAYVHDNARHIADMVLRCRDWEVLTKIAALVGFTPL